MMAGRLSSTRCASARMRVCVSACVCACTNVCVCLCQLAYRMHASTLNCAFVPTGNEQLKESCGREKRDQRPERKEERRDNCEQGVKHPHVALTQQHRPGCRERCPGWQSPRCQHVPPGRYRQPLFGVLRPRPHTPASVAFPHNAAAAAPGWAHSDVAAPGRAHSVAAAPEGDPIGGGSCVRPTDYHVQCERRCCSCNSKRAGNGICRILKLAHRFHSVVTPGYHNIQSRTL